MDIPTVRAELWAARGPVTDDRMKSRWYWADIHFAIEHAFQNHHTPMPSIDAGYDAWDEWLCDFMADHDDVDAVAYEFSDIRHNSHLFAYNDALFVLYHSKQYAVWRDYGDFPEIDHNGTYEPHQIAAQFAYRADMWAQLGDVIDALHIFVMSME